MLGMLPGEEQRDFECRITISREISCFGVFSVISDVLLVTQLLIRNVIFPLKQLKWVFVFCFVFLWYLLIKTAEFKTSYSKEVLLTHPKHSPSVILFKQRLSLWPFADTFPNISLAVYSSVQSFGQVWSKESF